MSRATYRIAHETPETIFIIDLDQGKSITNDAENVVERVVHDHGSVRIIYRDTMGRWDELVHDGSRFQAFAPYTGPVPQTVS